MRETDSFHDCYECKKGNLQKIRGCPDLGKDHSDIFYEFEGEMYHHCLVREVTYRTLDYLYEFSFLEVGIMPEPEGLNNQWEKDLQAFRVIASLKASYDEKKRER